MKAIIQHKYGGVETLELANVEKPSFKDNELLIEVHSANIASGDMRINTLSVPKGLKTIMRLIFGWNGPKNKVRGISASGKVVEIGKEVTKFKIGDKVNFINSMGASCMAEYISLKESKIISKFDDKIPYSQAAPIAFGAMSAYHFINQNNIKENDEVLIYGASGSVGSYALQLAKYYGAKVTAVSSKKNHELLKELGADCLIDYKTTDFTETTKKYDLIFDAVIKLNKSKVKGNLKSKGRFLSTKVPTSEKIERVQYLNELLKEGHIKTVIDQEFQLEKYKEAHELVYSKHKVGNVVIKFK